MPTVDDIQLLSCVCWREATYVDRRAHVHCMCEPVHQFPTVRQPCDSMMIKIYTVESKVCFVPRTPSPCVDICTVWSRLFTILRLLSLPLCDCFHLGRPREDVLVQVLHDLHHQPEAVHEGVDGDAQHAIGRGPVVDVQQHLALQADRGRGSVSGRGRGRQEGEVPPDERRQLRVDLDGLQRRRGQAVGGKGDLELTAWALFVSKDVELLNVVWM